jgi:ABC-2 type transport system ATP-binding protein
MPTAAIQTSGLCKTYRSKAGPVVAVQNLNLTVQTGEIFGLLGPNGAGKTTTVRMLCGLLPPTDGSACVDGFDVRQHPDQVRQRIGVVPEDAGDHKNLTLMEELEYHGALYGLNVATVRRRAVPLVDRLGLGDRQKHRLKTFSRGMRRKFHLIRALLHEPRVLLLDEPTAGLDPGIVEEVWDLLKTLAAERHVTVILCSHHLEEVERLCTRVAIIRQSLLAEGTLAELSGEEHYYRVRLTESAADFVPLVAQLEGVARVDHADSSLRFQLAGGAEQARDVVPRVVRCLVANGASLLELSSHMRDLRSLYRSFVDADGSSPAANGEASAAEHGGARP